MNNIFKPFIAIFKAIYYVIDRFLVMPISRFIYRISELNRSNSGRFEKLLNRPNVLVYISLFFAIAIFLVIDNKAINLVTEEAEILQDQVVNVIYNEEAYVVEGVPESVDITLIGRKSDLYLAKQLGEHEVVLDLSGYSVGTYKVKLRYNHSIESVNYKLDPSIISVKISEKMSVVKTLDFDVLNEDKLDSKLSIKNIKLDRTEVTVKGSAEALENVASVKALIDMKAANLTEKGSFTVDSNILVAYDNAGQKLSNVEIVPSKIAAIIDIESYYATKQVRIVTKGDLTVGYALATADATIKKVDVYGDEDIIKNLPYIEAVIDVTGVTSKKSYNVTLTKPKGVRFMSDTKTSIEITVDKESTRTFDDIYVNGLNVGAGYSANLVAEDQTISVIAKGVASILNNLDTSTTPIVADIDLSGLTPGVYDVPVKVSINDIKIRLQPKVTTVKVRIIANK